MEENDVNLGMWPQLGKISDLSKDGRQFVLGRGSRAEEVTRMEKTATTLFFKCLPENGKIQRCKLSCFLDDDDETQLWYREATNELCVKCV